MPYAVKFRSHHFDFKHVEYQSHLPGKWYHLFRWILSIVVLTCRNVVSESVFNTINVGVSVEDYQASYPLLVWFNPLVKNSSKTRKWWTNQPPHLRKNGYLYILWVLWNRTFRYILEACKLSDCFPNFTSTNNYALCIDKRASSWNWRHQITWSHVFRRFNVICIFYICMLVLCLITHCVFSLPFQH